MAAALKLNQCDEKGEAWGPLTTKYTSKLGMEVVTFIHPDGHNMRPEIPPLVVKFFKEQTGKEQTAQ
jgi:hypothetical protein